MAAHGADARDAGISSGRRRGGKAGVKSTKYKTKGRREEEGNTGRRVCRPSCSTSPMKTSDLLVVNKPADLVCHPTKNGEMSSLDRPGAGA